ncbi:MAG TPA: hypothetical protein PKB05_07405 [Oligoflexia bacterium]|nr:hypothetical protein [Oligoflexia bacterium]
METRSVIFYDQNIVKEYINFLRSESIKGLIEHFTYSKDYDSLSTPALSYLYYNIGDFEERFLETFIKKDLKRQENVTGLDIIESNEIKYNKQWEDLYLEAKKMIATHFSTFSFLIDHLCNRINYPMIGDDSESFSDPKRLGEFHYIMSGQSSFKWAEIMVHEITHNYLFIISSLPGFSSLAQWEKSVDLSLKDTKRPLIGLFHGVFAQVSMIKLSLNIIQSDSKNKIKEEASSLIKKLYSGFNKDVKVLNKYIKMSFDKGLHEYLLSVSHELEKIYGSCK